MGLFDIFKKKPTIPREALTLWVHRQSHFEQLQAVWKQDEQEFRFLPLGGVLGVSPALSTNKGLIPPTPEHFEGLGLDFDEAFRVASENTGTVLSSVGMTEAGFAAWEGAGVECLAVFGSMLRTKLGIKGTMVVLVPAEQLALAADAENEQALEGMLELAERLYGDSPEFRSLRALGFDGAQLPGEWLPPEGHRLHARFRAAAARTRRHEAEAEHQVFAAESAPLAHLAVLPRRGALTAAWMRDADVVIPEVDAVTLLDTPDEPLSRVEVPFEVLRECLAPAFEPLHRPGAGETEDDDDAEAEEPRPKLWRLRGALFPTPSERRFLVQRAAFASQSPTAEAREVPGAELLAAWDAGEAVLADGSRGGVRLETPDRRVATISVADFGDRIARRSLQDQLRFHHSFATREFLRVMARVMAEEAGEASAAEDEGELEMPKGPEDLAERAAEERPLLMSSNALRSARQKPAGAARDEVAELLLEQQLSSWEPSRLFPAVRPPGYEEGQLANVLGQVAGATGGEPLQVVNATFAVSRPAAEGLRLDLVSDRRDRMVVLNAGLLTPELTEAAWRTALLNVEAASLEPLRESAVGRYVSPWNDDYDFARLLLQPRLLDVCRVKGAPLVFAPTVGRVWVTGSDDAEGQGAVLDAIEAHLGSGLATTPYQFRQLLFGWPWTVKDGALVRFPLPATHPLAGRIAALDAQLERRRESSRRNVGDFARVAATPGTELPESEA